MNNTPISTQRFKIFLSSPGDVADERALAMRVLDDIQHGEDSPLKDRLVLDVVAWDKKGAPPMEAGLSPQEAINAGLPKPSECDIVIVIFWSRMGTPLVVDGLEYQSGTHYEFKEAMNASQNAGKPKVLIYWRTEKPRVELDDPRLLDKRDQYLLVKSFFNSFSDSHGKLSGGFNSYKGLDDFREKLYDHLLHVLDKLAEVSVKNKITEIVEPFESARDYQQLTIIDRLEEFGSPAVATLVSLLPHCQNSDGRNKIFRILQSYSIVALPLLFDLLNSDDWRSRWIGVIGLGKLRDSAAIPMLRKALTDASPQVKAMAEWALEEIGTVEALQALGKQI